MSKAQGYSDGVRQSDSEEYNNEKYDAENAGRRDSSTMVHGRKMSRIGPVTIGPVKEVDSYGKLVEMEAENAIKYRTCSWQKVRKTPSNHRQRRMPATNQSHTDFFQRGGRSSLYADALDNPVQIGLFG
jgi:hypothetical protein